MTVQGAVANATGADRGLADHAGEDPRCDSEETGVGRVDPGVTHEAAMVEWPDWRSWELELSAHLLKRMTDR